LKKHVLATVLAAALFSGAALADNSLLGIEKLWTYNHVANPGQVSEIPAFDRKTNTLWVAGVVGVDVLDAETGMLVAHIDTTAHGPINSVAVRHGIAAFAIEALGDRRNPGKVVFYDTKTRLPQGEVEVGALPDMLTFTHDGRKLLVANEGTPNAVADQSYVLPDPAGSVSIIDMATRMVTTAGFVGVPVNGANVRTNTGMDFEPEYIAIDQDGERAYVTLQEANAVAVLDLETNEFIEVIGLGVKDFSLADNGFGGNNFIDPNHKDGKIELRPAAVKGFYQPDSVAVHRFRGETYLVMANEGDTREDDGDKKRVKDSGLSGVPADLAQLNISTVDSTATDLHTFGGRSFSIRDVDGNLVYDSGSLLDAEAIARGIYDDGRSDDKGVEPEGVALLDIGGRTYAFIGLERTKKAAVAVFDITNPHRVGFIDMIVTDGDISPEGLAAYHHRGNFYLAIANEVSNTTTLYSLERRHPGKRH
jgi:hypothetical protein